MHVEGIDVTGEGVAHLHAVGRWLQEAAVADAVDAGMPREAAWIIRRNRLEIGQLPRFTERLELRTWCSGMAKSLAERTTTITGGNGAAVEAVGVWVFVDAETGRPARLPPDFHEIYAESAEGHRPRSSLRHPSTPPEGAEVFDWHFAQADIDLAGHVNNTMYLRVAEELLDFGALAAGGGVLEAEYRGGIGAGPARVHCSDGSLWIRDVAGTVAATIVVEPAG